MINNLIKIKKLAYSDTGFISGSLAVVWQVLFFYMPILLLITNSFFVVAHAHVKNKLTFENFFQILSISHLKIIYNSCILALSTSIFTLLIAFPFAYFIAFRGGKYKTLILYFLILPFWTNFLLHIYAWFFVLEKSGLLNSVLLFFNIIQSPINFLNTFFSVLVMMIYYYFPFMILPIFSQLNRFDANLFDASNSLGATKTQTFFKVLLPHSMKGIKSGFLIVFITAYGEFIIPELMGGDKYFFIGNTITQYIMNQNTAEIGAAFMVISGLCLIAAIYLISKTFKFIEKLILTKALS